eukprot:1769483-Pleurochrysis_carterae.AAC.1
MPFRSMEACCLLKRRQARKCTRRRMRYCVPGRMSKLNRCDCLDSCLARSSRTQNLMVHQLESIRND